MSKSITQDMAYSRQRHQRRPQAAQCPSRRHTDPPNQIGGGGESPPQGNPIKGRKGGKASPNEYAPFATMALEHGMDVKTLSATIGHVSSATMLDIYSHITDTMQRQAAVHIDRKIGGTDARMPTMEREERKDTAPVKFTPYKPKIRKPGTGCVTMINDHLYEGRYTPTNAYSKRESHNTYAKTREECEKKLDNVR